MSARTGVGFVLAAAAASLVGCSHPAPVGPVGNGGGGQSPGFLVWTSAEGGAETTRWLDGDGRVAGQAKGRLIAHAGKLWRIQLDKRTITGEGCSDGDQEPSEPGSGTAIDLSLVPLDGGTPLVIVDGPTDTGDAGEFTTSADVVGQLGRYLVIEEGNYIYACGVHGDGTSLSWVFDLSTGKRAPEMVTMADLGHLTSAARAALVEQADEGMEPDGELSLGESRPVWRGGKLAMRHLLYADTCYACSDGDWSSYTSAVWLDDAAAPAALTGEAAAVPAPVAAALDGIDQGGAVGVSWGRPDDRWRTAFAK